MKSLLRIIFGLLICIFIFFILFILSTKMSPRIIDTILGCSFALIIFGLFVFHVRKGRIYAAGSIYDRHKNPFGFWFYVFFYSFLILFCLFIGVCYFLKIPWIK